jgi:hypothetical protein
VLRRVHPFILLGVFLLLTVGLVQVGPAEKTLGTNIRLIYLHGAWVWTALIGFGAAAIAGAVGLLTRRLPLQRWSVALGQAATVFWITYLPMSLWVMQVNWNGLFLEEPLWRVGLNFAVTGLLIQGAILVLDRPGWASGLNLAFAGALGWSLALTREVMHPPAPIAGSGSAVIEGFFALLVLACVAAGWQLTRWLRQRAI